MYETQKEFTKAQKVWIVRLSKFVEMLAYYINYFSVYVVDLQDFYRKVSTNDFEPNLKYLKRKFVETLKEYGFYSKATKEKFNLWYKDKLTPFEKWLKFVEHLPNIGFIANILNLLISKYNAYICCADNNLYIKNPEKYSKAQLNEFGKLAEQGYDVSKLKNPALKAVNIRIGIRYTHLHIKLTNENIRMLHKDKYLKVLDAFASELFNCKSIYSEHRESTVISSENIIIDPQADT